MKTTKKFMALLLSVVMIFSIACTCFAAEEITTEKTQIEETKEEVGGFLTSIAEIIDSAHDLLETVLGVFGIDCPFCDDEITDAPEEPSEPEKPSEPEEDSSNEEKIESAIDTGFNLFKSIHNLVGGILGRLDKKCPLCDKTHSDKDDEAEEPTLPSDPTEKTYSVTFNTNGGSIVAEQTVKEGEAAKEPEKPTKEGFSFDGWYTDEALTERFDFSTAVIADTTLYAGWEEKSEAEQYYEENSQLIDIVNVEESEDVMTESEVKSFLEDRGFENCQITYSYSINGEYGSYGDKTEVSDESSDKHPAYQMIYLSESGEAWIIDVINGAIFANPFYYNAESETGVMLLVSETDELTSYDSEGNKFYVTIPNSTEVVVKVVDKIDSETLDGLTGEELSK